MKTLIISIIALAAFVVNAEEAKSAAGIESALRAELTKQGREGGAEAREKLFKSTIAEIEAYVKGSPDAKDLVKAQVLAAQLYSAVGESAKASAMLPDLYKQLPKGKDGDLDSAVPLTAMQARDLITKGDKKAATALLDTFEKDFESHPMMKEKGSRMVTSLRGQLNQPGPGDTMEIAFTSIDGKKVDLAEMKGKVVLVDFWATWCGPCVGELPNVKQAYEAYHGKGFEIVAISLDQDKGALESFIQKEKIPWPQAFDGKGWGNEIAQKFGIHSIPATFLVGKDGKVVMTNLRGPALEQKLAELLK